MQFGKISALNERDAYEKEILQKKKKLEQAHEHEIN